MHTRASFLVRFPEFSEGDTALIDAALAEAALQIDAATWGELATSGHGYLTAHSLAMSPMGNSAKLVKGESTTYNVHYQRLLRMVTAGIRST